MAIYGYIYTYIVNQRQLDLFQFHEDVSPLIQETFQFWLTGGELQTYKLLSGSVLTELLGTLGSPSLSNPLKGQLGQQHTSGPNNSDTQLSHMSLVTL